MQQALPTELAAFTPTLDQIYRLELAMLDLPLEQRIEPPVRHFWTHGLYAREMTIPAGTCLTGKAHLHEHINVISAGDITVWTEDGMKRIKAPWIMLSRPGTKRVGFAHEDTVWTTFHALPHAIESPPDFDVLEWFLVRQEAIGGPLAALERA